MPDSPPRLSRTKHTSSPPNNYARELETDEQRKTRSQQENKAQILPETQRDATTLGKAESEDEVLSTANLINELVKLRKEVRRRDELA